MAKRNLHVCFVLITRAVEPIECDSSVQTRISQRSKDGAFNLMSVLGCSWGGTPSTDSWMIELLMTKRPNRRDDEMNMHIIILFSSCKEKVFEDTIGIPRYYHLTWDWDEREREGGFVCANHLKSKQCKNKIIIIIPAHFDMCHCATQKVDNYTCSTHTILLKNVDGFVWYT